MAIDKFRKINIVIDKANDFVLEPLHVMQGDLQGRELVVQIRNGGAVEDQGDLALNLGWYHTGVENKGLDTFEPLNAAQGVFSIRYNNKMLTPGKVIATIQIISLDGVINTLPFEIVVGKNPIDATAIVTGDSFAALSGALDRVERWNEIIDEVIAENTDKIKDAIQRLVDKANGIEVNYTERLDELATDIKTIGQGIGDLSKLQTEKKASAVSAINEIKNRIDTFSPAPEIIPLSLTGAEKVTVSGSFASIEKNGSSSYLRVHGECQINNEGMDETHEVWNYGAINSETVSLHTNGEHLLIGAKSGQIIKMYVTDGSVIWDRTIPNELKVAKISKQGNVYALTTIFDPMIYRLFGSNGETEWTLANAFSNFISLDLTLDNTENLYYVETLQGSSGAPTKRCISVVKPDKTSIVDEITTTDSGGNSPTGGYHRGLVLDDQNRLYYYIDVNFKYSSPSYYHGVVRRNGEKDHVRILKGSEYAYHKGLIFDSNFYMVFPNSVSRRTLDGNLVENLPIDHNVINTIDNDKNGNLYYASTDGKSIVKLDLVTKATSIIYTFDGDKKITHLVCGDVGNYYAAMDDRTFVALRSGYKPFTSKQIESKKLIAFQKSIPITTSIPLKGYQDFSVLNQHAQYDLEIRADGVYTVASSTQKISGNAKIKFNGVFLIS